MHPVLEDPLSTIHAGVSLDSTLPGELSPASLPLYCSLVSFEGQNKAKMMW